MEKIIKFASLSALAVLAVGVIASLTFATSHTFAQGAAPSNSTAGNATASNSTSAGPMGSSSGASGSSSPQASSPGY